MCATPVHKLPRSSLTQLRWRRLMQSHAGSVLLAPTDATLSVQEAARESGDMRADLEALAADAVELRRALDDSQGRRQVRANCVLGGLGADCLRRHIVQHALLIVPLLGCLPQQLSQELEGLVGELSEVVRQQKLRMRGLAQERAEAQARLQAMNPQVDGMDGRTVWRFLALMQRWGPAVARGTAAMSVSQYVHQWEWPALPACPLSSRSWSGCGASCWRCESGRASWRPSATSWRRWGGRIAGAAGAGGLVSWCVGSA